MSYRITNKSGEDLTCNLTLKDFNNLIITKDYPMYDIKMYTLKSPTYNIEMVLKSSNIELHLYQNYRLKDFYGDSYLETTHVMTAVDKSLSLSDILSISYFDLLTLLYSRLEFLGSHYSGRIYNSERIPNSKPESDIIFCELGKRK